MEPGDSMYPKTVVFVYGTLKRGLRNHCFLEGAAYLGRGRTCGRFALHPGPGYPFASRTLRLYPLEGEVYEVDSLILEKLDRLEEHPREYRREMLAVELEQGQIVQAWTYLHPGPFHGTLERGEWNG
jgi:gamma-glutamylcyclotransferase (GGCT)/AIG2-like uncharacterized protein YtfP